MTQDLFPYFNRHRYNIAGEIISEATCTEPQKQTMKCACGATLEKITAEALGHSYGEFISDNNATCGVDGTQTKTCARCGDKITETLAGSALSHDLSYVSCTIEEKDGGYVIVWTFKCANEADQSCSRI